MGTFLAIFFAIVGVAILGVSLYMINRTKQLNRDGVAVTGKVTGIQKVEKNLNGKVVNLGYDTVFSIDYNGQNFVEKIRTTNYYEVGSLQSGKYIFNGKKGNFFLDGEGVYTGSMQNGLLMLYLSGIPFLLALIAAKPINQEILFLLLFIYIVAFAIGVRKSPTGFSRFKYDNPESAQGVTLREFFRFKEKTSDEEKSDTDREENDR